MSADLQDLLRRARQFKAQSGGSWREVLEQLDLVPENQERIKSLLLQAGLNEDQLANARALVEQMVAGLGGEERRQLAEVFTEVAAGKERALPPEIREFLAKLRQG